MNTVALVDSGGSNLGSLQCSLNRLGARVQWARDGDGLRGASHAILPGVGTAAVGMARLRERGLDVALRASGIPLLGICLGMQLLFESSDEGDVACLGLLPGRVRRLQGTPHARVPHMGWNTLQPLSTSRLLAGVEQDTQFYFVHSYAAPLNADCVAASRHGEQFAAVVERGRIAGAQFHPERSAARGARVLGNFLGWQA